MAKIYEKATELRPEASASDDVPGRAARVRARRTASVVGGVGPIGLGVATAVAQRHRAAPPRGHGREGAGRRGGGAVGRHDRAARRARALVFTIAAPPS